MSMLSKYREEGLFLLRVGLGGVFAVHGLLKLVGGPTVWDYLAIATGIHIVPVIFGFAAALIETAAGLFLVMGMYFRPACVALLVLMLMMLNTKYRQTHRFDDYLHALTMVVVFVGLTLVGPGRHSVDRR